MPSKILIVDDDDAMALLVKDTLSAMGYEARIQANAESALLEMGRTLPDLLILDLQLKGMSGLKLCEILKSDPRTQALPVIMLTSMTRESDKIGGLRMGADDYITKPFSMRELGARIEALLRRVHRGGKPADVLEAGGVRIDLEGRSASAGGEPVTLTKMEFELLALLLRKPGAVITFHSIGGAVWGEDKIATPHTITVTISRLKEKLGKAGDRIASVPGVGYRFSTDR